MVKNIFMKLENSSKISDYQHENLNEKKKNSVFSYENCEAFREKLPFNNNIDIKEKRYSEKNSSLKLEKFKEILEGPNVNIKLPKKKINTEEDKRFFKEKIRQKQKTELCKNWVLYNDCYFKDTCSFAHGEEELRLKETPINYKTQICKSFFEKGFCVYGGRCHYSHKRKYIKNIYN